MNLLVLLGVYISEKRRVMELKANRRVNEFKYFRKIFTPTPFWVNLPNLVWR